MYRVSCLRKRCPVQRADLGRTIFVETPTEACSPRRVSWCWLTGGCLSHSCPADRPRPRSATPYGQSSVRRMIATDNVPGDRARFHEIGHRGIRATMEQPSLRTGLDHCGGRRGDAAGGPWGIGGKGIGIWRGAT